MIQILRFLNSLITCACISFHTILNIQDYQRILRLCLVTFFFKYYRVQVLHRHSHISNIRSSSPLWWTMMSSKMTWKIFPDKIFQNVISASMTFDVSFNHVSTLFDRHAPLHKLSKNEKTVKQNHGFISRFKHKKTSRWLLIL